MLPSSNTWKRPAGFNDQEIWSQLRAGNHQALEYLYRAYSKDLFNFGMKLYGRHTWVQDTLQELFVDLWNQHQNLSAVSCLKSYLFKALKYKLQRQHQKELRWKKHVDDVAVLNRQVELPIENTIISGQMLKEQRMKIVDAMERLSVREKEVLHLLFDGGMNYAEAAEIMDIHVRSVYTLAWKAIRSLKKIILFWSLPLVCPVAYGAAGYPM